METLKLPLARLGSLVALSLLAPVPLNVTAPEPHVTLHPPVMNVADILPSPQVLELSEASRTAFAAPQHSPPELYTLHSSLLI